jgi:membrane associated rhomboid family serine protease
MIPIGDSPRARRTPYVTRAFILANVIVFVLTLMQSTAVPMPRAAAQREFNAQTTGVCGGFETRPTELDRFYCRWGFQPGEWFDVAKGESDIPPAPSRGVVLVSILTSVFVHGGWLHIIGNMIFLWVFGDNVEDRLGHAGFALFYLVGGVVASLAQASIDPDSLVPTVGASGAVAAVLGAYLIWYPRARVTTLIPIAVILVPIPIPAIVMIGFWFAQNLLSGLATLSPDVGTPEGGIAFFAHVGGFLFGAVMVLLFFRRTGARKGARGG